MYVSAEHINVESAFALYTLHFVETVMSRCNHTRFQIPTKAPEAVCIRLVISTSMVFSDSTVLPSYEKLLTDFSMACRRFQHVVRLRFVQEEAGRTSQFSLY